MPRKCCVYNCSSNYHSTAKKVKIFCFPFDKAEAERWRLSLPNVIEISKYIGVCVKHWPENYETIRFKGHDLPKHPPSIFTDVPTSCAPQCTSKAARTTVASAGTRNIFEDEYDTFLELDRIASWQSFKEQVASCDFVKTFGLFVKISDSVVDIYLISNHSVEIHLSITDTFQVTAKRRHTVINVRSLLGFQCHLERWCQLEPIFHLAKSSDFNSTVELQETINSLKTMLQAEDDNEWDKVIYLLDNILLLLIPPNGRRFNIKDILTASMFYFSSRSCYRVLRKHLALPHAATIKRYLGGMGEIGSLEDCSQVIASEFKNKNSIQSRCCIVMFDEIYVQASIRFRGSHLHGYADDDPNKAARTILAFLIKPLTGEGFICRLIPIYKLTAAYIVSHLQLITNLIHKNGGIVACCMSDNHPTNTNSFKALMNKDNVEYPWKIKNPSEHMESIYFLFDPVHLLKNIRNNWITETMKELKFPSEVENEQKVAKWKDLVKIHDSEAENSIRTTKLSYQSLFPSSVERQKVSLVLNVFNDKTSAALSLAGAEETAVFVKKIADMWSVLNVKSVRAAVKQNNPRCQAITDRDHPNLEYLKDMINCFAAMSGGRGNARRKTLTTETRNALLVSLHGLVELSTSLLDLGFHYILLGKFQSDRLEGEFGVYRQLSGGCYHLSVDQILNSAKLRRMQRYAELLEADSSLKPICITPACCEADFTEHELLALDDAPVIVNDFDDTQRASLYYVAGYVTFKESLPSSEFPTAPSSQFMDLVSRGRLSHPPEWLLMFCELSYAVFIYSNCKCANRLTRLLLHIYDTFYIDFNCDASSVCHRFSNLFFKGVVTKSNDIYTTDLPERKIKKLKSA